MLYVRLGGNRKPHGIVTFTTEEAVDELMARRPHVIDGQEVIVHRAAPAPGPLKREYKIQNLTVTAENNQALAQPDIKRYFSSYGKVADMRLINNNNSSAWIVYFDE